MWTELFSRGRPLVLAPMAGVTDSPFRRMVKRHGCDVLASEMVSSEALTRRHPRTFDMIEREEAEKPLVVQLFGSKPEVMARAAELLDERSIEAIDINMGCPVKKVVRTGAGAALLNDLPRAEAIVRAVGAATSLPVSVKIRSGWDHRSIVAVEAAKRLEQTGIQCLAVHPRTRAQGYAGEADWEVIADVKRAVSLPVIGNGDVREPPDAVEMVGRTGCDGVMIGRGAMGRPWIFARCRQALDGRPIDPPPGFLLRLDELERHLDLLRTSFHPLRVLGRLKLHGPFYFHGMPGATHLRQRLTHVQSIEEAMSFFQQLRERFQGRVGGDLSGVEGCGAS